MRLKKIKIIGFKSFADKVELVFHDGVTAIVGPNGCGKSNISDAFRWVMGEQSAKSMRGGNMLDVIFAGTSKRKPLNLAEVTLTFDNSEGRIDIPYREIEICRKYYRSQEGEYYLNGNQVRLKDIQALLMDLGVGKNAYAIFEQGKIDEVIQRSPEERRAIIDSAAGISRFLVNEKEALRKLEEVKINQNRLYDIEKEVAGHIENLKAQSMKAVRFKELKEKLNTLEVTLISAKINNLKEKEKELKDAFQKESEKRGAFEEKKETLKKELAFVKAASDEEEKGVKKEESAFYEIKGLSDVKKKELENITERLKDAIERLKTIEKEKKEIEKLKVEREKEIEKQGSEQEVRQKALENAQSNMIKCDESFKAQEKERSQKQTDVSKCQDKTLKLSQEQSRAASQLKQLEVRLEIIHEKKVQLKKDKEKSESACLTFNKESEAKKIELEEASSAIGQAKIRFTEYDNKVKQLNKEQETLAEKFEDLKKNLIDLKAKENTLKRLQNEMEGFSPGSKVLLKQFPSLKKLYECLEVPVGREAAMAGMLRYYGDTLVAKEKTLFLEVISYAKENKISDFSLLSLEEIKIPLQDHFMEGKKVFANLEEGLKNRKENQEIYSLDGFYFDRQRVLFAGNPRTNSIFLREGELKVLNQKISTLSEDYTLHESRYGVLKTERQTASQNLMEADKLVRSLEMKMIEKNYQYQKICQDIERMQKQILENSESIKKEEAEIIRLDEEISKNRITVSKHDDELKKEIKLREVLEKHLLDADTLLKQEKKKLDEARTLFQSVQDDARKTGHSLKLLEVKEQESVSNLHRLGNEKEKLEKQAKEFSIHEETLKIETEALKKELLAKEKLLKEVQTKWEETKKHFIAKQKEVEQEEVKVNSASKGAQEKEIALTQNLTMIDSMEVFFKENFPGQSIREDKGPVNRFEKEIRETKEDLQGYTDVNLGAELALETQVDRLKILKANIGDLEGTDADLRSLIEKLKAESRTLFFETFEKVRANFKKNFAILFNGGDADLELTSQEDLLKAGVEIQAKPPGKQMRSINLLSGGEKCLTAMALLFAIFETKASPFCILDEIDAPLDDTNVGRFVEMVKHFKDKSQFIIITHNKRTMAMADRLFGVSMEEKGVSKLLMMEFQHKEVSLV